MHLQEKLTSKFNLKVLVSLENVLDEEVKILIILIILKSEIVSMYKVTSAAYQSMLIVSSKSTCAVV